MTRKTIAVTETLIAKAQQADSNHCMIASAIRENCPAFTNVAVDLQTIRVTDRAAGKRYVFLTPLRAQQQLLRFDQGFRVDPWSFTLPRTPAQVLPIQVRHAPAAPKTVTTNSKRAIPTVQGGKAPPAAVLSNSRGQRRVFGIKAAKGWDPSQPDG